MNSQLTCVQSHVSYQEYSGIQSYIEVCNVHASTQHESYPLIICVVLVNFLLEYVMHQITGLKFVGIVGGWQCKPYVSKPSVHWEIEVE